MRTGLPFVDLDALTVARQGRSIPELFAAGEPVFRAAESRALADALAQERAVLSTGGGTPCQPGAMDALLAWGKVVFLDLPLESIRARVAGDGRPLWDDAVEQRFHERQATYRRGITVPAEGPVDEVADRVLAACA